MTSVKIGPMRHRVTLLAPTNEVDSLGEDVPGWSEVATVWARVEELSAREIVVTDQTRGQRVIRVTIRYRPGITSEWKVTHDGMTAHVDGILNPDRRNRWLELTCVEEM